MQEGVLETLIANALNAESEPDIILESINKDAIQLQLRMEQSLLGALIIDDSAYYYVSQKLSRHDFSEELHARIYDIIGALNRAEKLVCAINISKILGEHALTTDEPFNDPKTAIKLYLSRLAAIACKTENTKMLAVMISKCAKFQFQQLPKDTQNDLKIERSKWDAELGRAIYHTPEAQKRKDERAAEQRREYDTWKHRQAQLQFMNYSAYLQTPEWQATRKRALILAGFSCQVCNGRGKLDVHHRTYERRGSEIDSDLIALCAGCHQLFHQQGRLAEPPEADSVVLDSTRLPDTYEDMEPL